MCSGHDFAKKKINLFLLVLSLLSIGYDGVFSIVAGETDVKKNNITNCPKPVSFLSISALLEKGVLYL